MRQREKDDSLEMIFLGTLFVIGLCGNLPKKIRYFYFRPSHGLSKKLYKNLKIFSVLEINLYLSLWLIA